MAICFLYIYIYICLSLSLCVRKPLLAAAVAAAAFASTSVGEATGLGVVRSGAWRGRFGFSKDLGTDEAYGCQGSWAFVLLFWFLL